MINSTPQPTVAERDWSRMALVEIVQDTSAKNVHGDVRVYRAGDLHHMTQWGHVGMEISTYWWSSYDTDGAFIIAEEAARVIRIIREVTPTAP